MSYLRIIHPGTYATVQDLGRPGYSEQAVARGGAADRFSLAMGNRLIGNPDTSAGIEFSLSGGRFAFEDDTIIVMTGVADGPGAARPECDGHIFPLWEPIELRAGQVVNIGGFTAGASLYLCVRGGVNTAPVLGGRGTHHIGGFGGHEGRALITGDRLPIGTEHRRTPRSAGAAWRGLTARVLDRSCLRIMPGPQAPLIAGAFDEFWRGACLTMTPHSDRAGSRFNGPRARREHEGTLVTEGAFRGAMQYPGDGLWIILGPDGPTTGGYPIAASVSARSVPALGQLRPSDSVVMLTSTPREERQALRVLAAEIDAELPPVDHGRGPVW